MENLRKTYGKHHETTGIPQPVLASIVGDVFVNRQRWELQESFLSRAHGCNTWMDQNRSRLVAKTGDVFEAVSAAEIHSLVQPECCSSLKVFFHANALF